MVNINLGLGQEPPFELHKIGGRVVPYQPPFTIETVTHTEIIDNQQFIKTNLTTELTSDTLFASVVSR